MSQEIVEAVRALAREKGISEEKLITALEDALLSAYKKQPDAVRYARVRMDPDLGEYRVEQLILPEDLEEDRKSTRLNSSHANISYAVFCLKKTTTLPRASFA